MSEQVVLDYVRRPSALAYMLRGAVPRARGRGTGPAIVVRWAGHRVQDAELQGFLRLTGAAAGPQLPLLYPHVFGFRLAMAALTHPRFPVPIWGVLQTRNHVLQHRPILASEALDFEVRFRGARVVAKGLELDLRTVVHAGGAPAWESLVTFLARGRFGPPGRESPLARAPAPAGPQVAEWEMGDDAHWQFARYTGDYNGIHAWGWYARRFGFPRALYHPPRVLGQCLARLAGPNDGAARRLDVWLKGPVLHGARVRLHAAPEPGGEGRAFALFAEPARPCVVGRIGAPTPGSRLVDERGEPLGLPDTCEEERTWSESAWRT